MDDSDLALDMALERLDESSDIEEDSQTGSIYSGDGVSQLEVYTPSSLTSNPKTGYAARRGSLHNSGSEDSNSLSSFCTDSEAGPARSAVFCHSRRNMTNGSRRGAMSDSETTRPRKVRHGGACLDMNIRVPEEEFFYRIRERLMAVSKDREAMTMKARDLARQRGETYEEIMAVEWYELPEARKYLLISSTPPETVELPETSKVESIPEEIVEDRDERPSSPRLTISPSELTPRSGISEMDGSRIRSTSSQHQLEEGMRTLQVGGMTRSRRSHHRHISGSSSVLSATSDSGVGDTWATSEMNTPPVDRIQAYLQRQSMITTSLPPRERDAHAAAIALISNSPHPENLNPQVPMHLSRQQQQHPRHHHHHHYHHQRNADQRQQQRVAMPHYSSGDDSSSVFTMTSQSSTSDLFIPRKTQPPMYTDSEEPHHFGNKSSYRRMLTTPKRSHMKQHGQGPSPLTEQHRPRMAQTPQQGDMMLSTPQQTQQPQHSMSPGGSGGNVGGGGSSGTVHVIYHLDNIPTPFHAKWTNGVGITLGTFKDQVFARKGEYRFFFESFNPDLDMALLEEFTEDETCLPIIKGKIVGRVERAQ